MSGKKPTEPGYYLVFDTYIIAYIGVVHALYGSDGDFHCEWVYGTKRERIHIWDPDWVAKNLR